MPVHAKTRFKILQKRKNQQRNTNGGGATSGPPPVRVTFLIFCFVLRGLGPCLGMNGHPRGATDVILRLSWSTIDVLSIFIGFRSQSRVNIIILNEILTFICFFMKMLICFSTLYFDPGLFGDVLGIENQFYSIEKSKLYDFLQFVVWPQNRFFNWRIDFSIKKRKKKPRKNFEKP